jgi:hypothetical protein
MEKTEMVTADFLGNSMDNIPRRMVAAMERGDAVLFRPSMKAAMLVRRKLPSGPVVADIPLFLIATSAPAIGEPSELTILPLRRMSLAMQTTAAKKMRIVILLFMKSSFLSNQEALQPKFLLSFIRISRYC